MTAGFADDDWGFVYSAKFQRMLNDWNKMVSSPASQQNLSKAINRQIDTTKMAQSLASQMNTAGVSDALNKIVTAQIDTTKNVQHAAAQIDTTKFAQFAEAIIAAQVKPLMTPEVVAGLNKTLSLAVLNSPSYDALRQSMDNLAQTMTRNDVFSKIATGNLSVIGSTFSSSVDSLLGTYETEFEQLAAETTVDDVDVEEATEPAECTDFQAFLIVRVWAALVVWGWAVEDWLSTQTDAAREKYGEQAVDIRNRVIATVIAGVIIGAGKFVWTNSQPG